MCGGRARGWAYGWAKGSGRSRYRQRNCVTGGRSDRGWVHQGVAVVVSVGEGWNRDGDRRERTLVHCGGVVLQWVDWECCSTWNECIGDVGGCFGPRAEDGG